MNFQNLPTVPQEKELLDRAFRKARIRQKTKKEKKGTWVQGMQTNEARKLDLIRDVLVASLDRVQKSFPQIDELPRFYQELIKITRDVVQLKKSLATVVWGIRKISDFQRTYIHHIMQEKDKQKMQEFTRQFYGRVSSVLKQISSALKYLESSRQVMKGYPDVKEMFTVCIYGFPNVGKSTLLNLLTGTRAEVAPYAFTTKSINVGYLRLDGSKEHGDKERSGQEGKKGIKKATIQIIDVPGTLARQDKLNFIEMQADLVVKELATVIIYVFDYSDTCGYTIADQEKLFEQVTSADFSGKKKPVLVYVAKKDITPADVLENAPKSFSLEELKEEILKRNIQWEEDEALKTPVEVEMGPV